MIDCEKVTIVRSSTTNSTSTTNSAQKRKKVNWAYTVEDDGQMTHVAVKDGILIESKICRASYEEQVHLADFTRDTWIVMLKDRQLPPFGTTANNALTILLLRTYFSISLYLHFLAFIYFGEDGERNSVGNSAQLRHSIKYIHTNRDHLRTVPELIALVVNLIATDADYRVSIIARILWKHHPFS